jgi:hypothetical protein
MPAPMVMRRCHMRFSSADRLLRIQIQEPIPKAAHAIINVGKYVAIGSGFIGLTAKDQLRLECGVAPAADKPSRRHDARKVLAASHG